VDSTSTHFYSYPRYDIW